MGRNKISIERISNEKNRVATFNKRRAGLIKKAMELSILCGCEISMVVYGIQGNNTAIKYTSSNHDLSAIKNEYQVELTNEDVSLQL